MGSIFLIVPSIHEEVDTIHSYNTLGFPVLTQPQCRSFLTAFIHTKGTWAARSSSVPCGFIPITRISLAHLRVFLPLLGSVITIHLHLTLLTLNFVPARQPRK